MVILLLTFCWSFYFQFSMVETGSLVNTNERVLPIYYVETDEKAVALTFDSAWNTDDLDDILMILDKNNIKATFFMTGDWVERYPEAVKKLYEYGHDLGNHGENHKNMSELSREECEKEIQSVHDRVYEITEDAESGETLYITIGDASNKPDPYPVAYDQIVGRYVRELPYGEWLYRAIRFLADQVNYFIIVILPLLLCCLSYVRQFFKALFGKEEEPVAEDIQIVDLEEEDANEEGRCC